MQLSAPKVGQKSRFSYAANGLDSLSQHHLHVALIQQIAQQLAQQQVSKKHHW